MADSTTSQADMSGGLSLLSLSIAAASASPIPVANNAPQSGVYNGQGSWNGSLPAGVNGSFHTNGHVKQHRRLSSTGQARRRLSDARDAAVRPSAATIQTAAAALSSLATLSISGAPPPASLPHSQGQGVFKLEASPSTTATPIPIPAGGEKEEQDTQSTDAPTSNSSGKPGKKRGTLYQCESCSKVYRHPSCLIKHRWEHSPQWREASKFVLSKHQQVQLLEAAAILSHLSPSASGGTSLPEDRSLWPSFLSGGLLPPPSTTNMAVNGTSSRAKSVSSTPSSSYTGHPISSSVPAKPSTRSPSTGPRLHDYTVRSTSGTGGITHIRPGLVGVPTAPSSGIDLTDVGSPPMTGIETDRRTSSSSGHDSGVPSSFNGGLTFSYPTPNTKSEPYGSPVLVPYGQSLSSLSSSFHHSSIISRSQSHSYGVLSTTSEGTGGWSLPSSSLRSHSGSRSDDEEEGSEFIDIDDVGFGGGFSSRSRGRIFGGAVKEEEEDDEARDKGKESEEWDGMEMEMEMD